MGVDDKEEGKGAESGDNGEGTTDTGADQAAGEGAGKGSDEGAGTEGSTEGITTEQVDAIQAKVEAGEELSPEEQALLDSVEDKESESEGGNSGEELTAEEKSLLEKVSPKMQQRLSKLAQENREMKEQIAKLSAEGTKKSGQKPISEFTDQELFDLESANPDYRPYVLKELARREAKKVYDEGNKESTLKTKKAEYDRQAASLYPEILNEDSKLHQLATKIYWERGYNTIVDGSLIAAEKAAKILGKQKASTIKTNAARLAEIKKKGLGGAGRPAAGSSVTSSKLEQLEEEASKTRPGSDEWAKVFRERRRIKELKAKGKG